ncbi:MAG: lipase secretion chaperone [Sulfurifustis sp.]
MNKTAKVKVEESGLRSTTFRRFALVALVVVVASIVVAELYFSRPQPPAPAPAAPAPAVAQPQLSPEEALAAAAKAEGIPLDAVKIVAAPAKQREPMAKVVGNIGEKFHVDAKGQLVENQNTRLHIEALVGLIEPDKLYDTIEDELRNLPRDAAARARELVERYKTYQQDQRKLVPPGVAPVTEDEALAQLDAMHGLRVAYFGENTAQAFYGQDEAVIRELIELMRNEKDPTLTLQEKAERAQARYSQLHRAQQKPAGQE